MLDYISAFNYIIYVIHIFWHVCIICLYVYVHIYKSISRLEKTIVSRIQISIYMFVNELNIFNFHLKCCIFKRDIFSFFREAKPLI